MSVKEKNDLALRSETSLANVGNQISITNKILKSIKEVQLPIFGTFTDPRDGNVYKTVKIGDQVWMAENLRYIPHVGPNNSNDGIWVYNYNGHKIKEAISSEYYSKYGCLYNWDIAKLIAPVGWHLPTDTEWTILITYLGGESFAGDKLKEIGIANWIINPSGTNKSSGFSALPSGLCKSGIACYFIGESVFFWSASEGDDTAAWYCSLLSNSSDITRNRSKKHWGMSVRLLQDNLFI